MRCAGTAPAGHGLSRLTGRARNVMQLLRGMIAIGAAAALLAVSGCTSSDNGSSGGSSTTNATPTGIWSGTDLVTGLSVAGYIDSGGQADFVRADGAVFIGPTQVSGDTLVAAVVGYASFGNDFSDGSTYGLGTLNGTVTSASTLTLALTFTTNGGTAQSGSWSLSFSSLSNSGSSLASVSANYTDASGATVSINGDGAMSGQNANNGCVLNGSISVSDASYDVYAVSFTYEDCTGSYAVLNGVQFTGLAAFNGTRSPAQLSIVVSGASSASKYALVLDLDVS